MTGNDCPRAELLARLDGLAVPEPVGPHMIVAVYVRPEKTRSGLYLADQTRQEDIYQGTVALVLKQGPDCYRPDSKHSFSTEWCQVGDWVQIPNTSLIPGRFRLKGVTLAHVSDIDIRAVIADPRDIMG